jgi:hypothetical protein
MIIRFTDLRVKTRYGCLGLLPSQPNHKVSSWPGAAPSPCHTSDSLRWTAAVRRDQLEHLWAGRRRQIGDGCRRVCVAPRATARPAPAAGVAVHAAGRRTPGCKRSCRHSMTNRRAATGCSRVAPAQMAQMARVAIVARFHPACDGKVCLTVATEARSA